MIHKADSVGFFGGNHVPGHDHLVRLSVSNKSLKSLRRTVSRDEAQIDLRRAEGGAVAGDSNIARTGHFATSSKGETIDHGDGRFAQVPQGLNRIVSETFSNHGAAGACEFSDVGSSHKGVRLGPFSFGRRVGRCTRYHQNTHVVGFLHPSADGFERRHHVGVQGVEFVGPVDGEACDVSELLFIADRMKVDLHNVALRWLHGATEGSPLLDVIAVVQ